MLLFHFSTWLLSTRYPSLLDADAPFGTLGAGAAKGLSYSLLGNASVSLYFVISRRFIARLPVAFVPGDAPTPPGPFPPPPPPPLNPPNCSRFAVAGAGMGAVNGVYVAAAAQAATPTLFQMDGAHQLYRFQDRWKLAHYGDAGTAPYYTSPVNASDARVPITGWQAGIAPQPTVTCDE